MHGFYDAAVKTVKDADKLSTKMKIFDICSNNISEEKINLF